jgi:hypothetical protein
MLTLEYLAKFFIDKPGTLFTALLVLFMFYFVYLNKDTEKTILIYQNNKKANRRVVR